MQYILIPQYISRKAFLSIQSILIVAILAYYLDYIRLCILLNGLYITSLIHWNKVYNYSLIKLIDIIFAIGTVYSITYYDSNRFHKSYIIIWNVSITISISVFIINEILFYYQVLRFSTLKYPSDRNKLLHHFSFETPTLEGVLSDSGNTFSALEMRKCVKKENEKILIPLKNLNLRWYKTVRYHYFSLEYAYPNTRTRELYYYRSVYTHMIFLHILPTTTCAFCAIMTIL